MSKATIIYLGRELDIEREHELVKDEPGFCVQCQLGERYGNVHQTLHNITEVHWMYPDSLSGKRVAFESDVHSTGYTYDIEDVILINISVEEKICASV